jgi:N-acetylneuraminic acid mutarotase
MDNMPTARSMSGSCILDGRIYVIGGAQGNTSESRKASTEVYDIEADDWTVLQNMNFTRGTHTVETVNGKIYAIGGWMEGGSEYSNVEEYDPAEDTWTVKSNLPESRRMHTSCVINDTIYVMGGYSSSSDHLLKSARIYDPASDTWDTIADMNYGRSAPSCCLYNNKIYVFGGLNYMTSEMISEVEVYDPTTDTWTALGPISDSSSFLLTVSHEEEDQIVIFSGSANSFEMQSSVYTYKPASNQFLQMEDMPFEWYGMAGEVQDNFAYIMGGEFDYPSGVSDTVWKFNLDSLKEKPIVDNIDLTFNPDNDIFSLNQISPNPVFGLTEINYDIQIPGRVTLEIFNCIGERVTLLENKIQVPGDHTAIWNTEGITSGIYFCSLSLNGYVQTRKLIVSP